MLSEKGDLDLRGGKHSPSSRIPWLTTLLGVLGFSFVAGLFLWWRVRHHDSLAKPVALLHPPTMNVDPLARCQMDKQEYTVRNGKAALRPNRRGHRQEECAGRSNGLVVPATAECPFLIAVYRPQPDVYDIVSNAIRTQGFWEPRESGIIEDLPQESFFVDIGANIGWYTLLALSLGHRVLAFEPMSDNVQLLRHSLCLNPGLDERLELHEVALSENADCLLGSNSQNAGDGVLLCEEQVQSMTHESKAEVALKRLDAFLQPGGPQVDLLKIDVEGHELAVLRSAEAFFRRTPGHKPPAYIISEINPEAMRSAGYDPLEYLTFFADRGYQIAYKEVQWEQYKVAWRKGQGSPRAEQVLPRREFSAWLKTYDFTIPPTIECQLLP